MVIGNVEHMHKCWTIQHGNNKHKIKLIIVVFFYSLIFTLTKTISSSGEEKHFPFSMAIENVNLIHKCYPPKLMQETARIEVKETDGKGRKHKMWIEYGA